MRNRINTLALAVVLTFVCGSASCGFANSVRVARPMVIRCTKPTLERHHLILEALTRHSFQLVKEDRVTGIYTAARFPSPVFLGDQVMFQGGLHLKVVSDSSSITLFLYKAMDAETDNPKFEVSYDERNSPLYIKPFFDGLLSDLRKACAE
ncbi:MAG: hypothetical protein SFU91_15305 [Chloroherpetonaceae bacterium]|nr:hypothetical protein [Chloroherpetonaceae bacterium]